MGEPMLTGEPMPATKRSGDEATGGTLDTTLSKIVQMVGQAQRSRVPIQRLAGTVSIYFVLAVVLVAIVAFFAWWLFGPSRVVAVGAARRKVCSSMPPRPSRPS